MKITTAHLETTIAAARKAGDLIAQMRRSNQFSVSEKGPRNLLTTADFASEKLLISELSAILPEAKFLTEEGNPEAKGDLNKGAWWVIDPIDGTTNFIHGNRHVGISIGLVVDGVGTLGVVHGPFLDETYSALRGNGAFCNNRRLAASKETVLQNALVATGYPAERDKVPELAHLTAVVLSNCGDIRRFGAASLDLCNVAAGNLDAYFETVKPWDMAAGAVIVREAGGIFGRFAARTDNTTIYPEDMSGDRMLAAAPGVFEGMVRVLSIRSRR